MSATFDRRPPDPIRVFGARRRLASPPSAGVERASRTLGQAGREVGVGPHRAAVGGHEAGAVLDVDEFQAPRRACACSARGTPTTPTAMPPWFSCIALPSVPVPPGVDVDLVRDLLLRARLADHPHDDRVGVRAAHHAGTLAEVEARRIGSCSGRGCRSRGSRPPRDRSARRGCRRRSSPRAGRSPPARSRRRRRRRSGRGHRFSARSRKASATMKEPILLSKPRAAARPFCRRSCHSHW